MSMMVEAKRRSVRSRSRPKGKGSCLRTQGGEGDPRRGGVEGGKESEEQIEVDRKENRARTGVSLAC